MAGRRPLVLGLMVAMLGSLGVGCSGGDRSNAAPGPLTITVDVGRPGAVVPADFLGLSFEASVLDSKLFDPAQSNLAALLRDLGPGRLRFGGNSLDRVTAWVPDGAELPAWARARVTTEDLGRLGALTAATGWRVDLGLGLGHPDAVAAAVEVAAAARLLGSGLGTVDIGNEPDLFAHDRALKPSGYTYADYRADLDRYRSAIAAAVPGVGVAGPDTAGPAWLAAYLADEHTGLSFVTRHFYPLTRCAGVRPTIADLLSQAATDRVVATIDAAVATAREHDLSVRIDETNSASCGGQDGVSNTMASALWITNYLLLAASHGVAGVNVHGGLAACRGYTPICLAGATGPTEASRPGVDPIGDLSLGAGPTAGPTAAGRLTVQPDFYGLLLVHQVEGGRWLGVRSDRRTPIQAFAVAMADGSVRLVLDNPDGKFAGNVTVRAAGHRWTATVLRLSAPSLAATSGVRLGSAGVTPDGTWHPQPDHISAPALGEVRLGVPAASAAVVTLSP
jgi:hypothetical protein